MLSVFYSFPGNDEMFLRGVRLEKPPVLAAQRVVGKNVQCVPVVEEKGETSCRSGFDFHHQELPRFILE